MGLETRYVVALIEIVWFKFTIKAFDEIWIDQYRFRYHFVKFNRIFRRYKKKTHIFYQNVQIGEWTTRINKCRYEPLFEQKVYFDMNKVIEY